MFRGSNSDALLEKHFGLTNLVSPTKRTDFSDSEEEEEKIDFKPPPEIKPDILSQTPVIRLTTPIRKKSRTTDSDEEDRTKDDEEETEEKLRIPERKLMDDISTIIRSPMRSPARSPMRSPARSPVIDISDEDEINERVNDIVNFPGNCRI